MKKLNKKGFTLIELIVVIGILAVLAVILIPSIMNYVGKAEDAAKTANARSAYSAAALEVATKNYVNLAAVKTASVANVPGIDATKLNVCGTVNTTVTPNLVTNITGVYYDGKVFPAGATCAAP